MKKIVLTLIFITLVALSLSSCTLITDKDTSKPEDAETPADTEFGRMLGYMPYSFIEEHDIWFSDWARAKEVHGIEDASSIKEIASLPEEEREALRKASMEITPTSWRYLELEPIVGFNGMMIDRMVFTEIIPPRSFSLSEGNFDEELISSKLTGLGYTKMEYGDNTYYGTGEDYNISLENELARMAANSMNCLAAFDNTIIAAPASKYVTGMFDTRDGNVPSIVDNAACRALADSLGSVLTAVMTIPERIIFTDLRMKGVPKFEFTVPDDWGLLHQFDMAAMGYRNEGEKRFLVIALYYEDESAAKADGVLIIKRMETYTLGTWLPNMDNIPFIDRYRADDPVIEEYPEGVVLKIACQLMPEERRGASIDMGGAGGALRDFLFLAPDPSLYIAD